MAGYQSLIDALNGGGAGAAGDTFQDGPFSDLLNAMGFKPYGYADRQGQSSPRPEANPMYASSMGGGGSVPQTPLAPPPSGAFPGFAPVAVPPGMGGVPLRYGAASMIPAGMGRTSLGYGDMPPDVLDIMKLLQEDKWLR